MKDPFHQGIRLVNFINYYPLMGYYIQADIRLRINYLLYFHLLLKFRLYLLLYQAFLFLIKAIIILTFLIQAFPLMWAL